jgi:hypothetical protein
MEDRQSEPGHGPEPERDKDINIQIDRVHYKVEAHSLTGAQLRLLPPSGIPADRDLFQVVPAGSDRKIADTDVVELHNGARFFTAPARINPGRKGKDRYRGIAES